MNTNIKEEVLEIILKAGYVEGEMNDIQNNIPNLFFEFIKWKDFVIGLPNKNGLYLYWEDHFTLEQLCNYWLVYIYKT